MATLDLAAIDLDALASALEDNSPESSWWIDPESGEVAFRSVYGDAGEDVEDFEGRDWVRIEPVGSRQGYADMEEFVHRLRAGRPRELLERAIQGRGAFRRFKDTLLEFPDLRRDWFAFHDRRMRRRSIEWLASEGLVDPAIAEAELAKLDEANGPLATADVASRAADALRDLYGERLAEVVLHGSAARGQADPESDLDLLVVLRAPVSPWEELRRMDDLLWRLSSATGVVVSALPVSDEQWRADPAPVLAEARAQGVVVP